MPALYSSIGYDASYTLCALAKCNKTELLLRSGAKGDSFDDYLERLSEPARNVQPESFGCHASRSKSQRSSSSCSRLTEAIQRIQLHS